MKNPVLTGLLLLCLNISTIIAQKPYGENPLAHTYSIVAYDFETGEMGVAVQSHWFSTGTIVIWGEAGVGVVATQSFVNPGYGPEGLALMKKGKKPNAILKELTNKDEGKEFRQVAFLNKDGEATAFTGNKCIEAAGHIVGKGYAVQANMMLNDKIWPAMSEAYESAVGLPLAQRMMKAMEAAQDAGGDIRGKQSAAILVVAPESSGKSWLDRRIDLRVEDHPEPIQELKRLLKVHEAYQHMNRGDLAVEKEEPEAALREYRAAEKMFPDNLEMKYWHAVALVNMGRLNEALPMFKQIFEQNENWRMLTPRLIPNGVLKVNKKDLEKIMTQ